MSGDKKRDFPHYNVPTIEGFVYEDPRVFENDDSTVVSFRLLYRVRQNVKGEGWGTGLSGIDCRVDSRRTPHLVGKAKALSKGSGAFVVGSYMERVDGDRTYPGIDVFDFAFTGGGNVKDGGQPEPDLPTGEREKKDDPDSEPPW
jgi:hypothetical protein